HHDPFNAGRLLGTPAGVDQSARPVSVETVSP
ncbi:MAG: hypothetical protein QOG60_2254, partial [Frankiaceae bacterium]|nr:hypothetical protein [Frankiaceae bacterium]